ncbi:MAG TPA: homoserine O-acetyltransferase, partial [Afipia sp.]|nr:homoserine O-acetyltransferase [Afipia sp.]
MVNVKPLKSDTAAAERAHEADHPSSLVAQFGADKPLRLGCG